MFKNLRLSVKIALGFGAVLVIAIALGSLGVWNMEGVRDNSVQLQNAYMPEVDAAGGMERNTLEAMYQMVHYAYSGEKTFLNGARDRLSRVHDRMKEAHDLARSFPQLVQLKEGVGQFEIGLKAYEQLVDETVAKLDAIEANRGILTGAAQVFMSECSAYLSSQNAAMAEELKASAESNSIAQRLHKITLINDIIDLGNAVRLANFQSQALRDPKFVQDVQGNFPQIDSKLDEIKADTSREANLKQIAKVREANGTYKAALGELLGNWLALQEIGRKRKAAGDELVEISTRLSRAGIDQTVAMTKAGASELGAASTMMGIGLVMATIVGIALARAIVLSITKPINRVATGLRDGSEQVASASTQVSSASQQLAEGASEQAASIEETSASLEQMSSMTRQNAENAGQANHIMRDVHRVVEQANQSMSELTTSMAEISRASEETQKIIRTIDEIAFQTNLLALNAAVEAARAGEAGAGFAVVADEVRNLAMRAAEAAKNTAALIEGTVKTVKGGAQLVDRSNAEFAQVAGSVTRAGELVGEIAAASQEQAQGIEQVNKAVSEMDKVVQQNAANAEESASASEEMNAQAEQMRDFIGELLQLIAGRSATSAASPGMSLPVRSARVIASTVSQAPARPGNGNSRIPRKSPVALPRGEIPPNRLIPMDDEELKDF